MTFIEPLDLYSIFVPLFAGSMQIFLYIAFLVIAAMAARFRMPTEIAMIMFGLFGIFMASYAQDLFFLVIVVAGMAVFYSVGRLVKY